MPRDYGPTWAQKKFAREYHEHGDPAAAAKSAGSKAIDLYQAGYKFLSNSKVKRLLAEFDANSDAASSRKHSELEEEVHSLIDEGTALARKGKPIIARDGKIARGVKSTKYPKGEPLYQPDVPSLLKSAELKGKTIAMFVDKQRIEGELDSKSNPELKAILLAALEADKTLCKEFCQNELIIRTVNEQQREIAASDEGSTGVQPTEAESLPPSSEASEVPQGWRH